MNDNKDSIHQPGNEDHLNNGPNTYQTPPENYSLERPSPPTPSETQRPAASHEVEATHKSLLLNQVTNLARSGLLSWDELKTAFNAGSPRLDLTQETVSTADSVPNKLDHSKLSAPQVLFTLGGLVMFGAVVALLSQAWDGLGSIQRVLVSLGLGLLLWALGVAFSKRSQGSETSEGLGDSFILAGSLAVISGMFITFSELGIDDLLGESSILFLILFLLSSLHFGLDLLVRRTVTIVFTVLLSLSAYYALTNWIFGGLVYSQEFWSFISIIGGLLLIGVGWVFLKGREDRRWLKDSFWGLGGFIILSSFYVLTFSNGLRQVWEVIFPLILYAAFMVSIKHQSKNFLASGSVFLLLYVLTVSFRYFGSGLGYAVALMVASIGIIGSAILIVNIRKKYFPT